MRTSRASAAAAALAVLGTLLIGAPTHARPLAVDDPAGDRSGRGLDITRAVLKNRDHRLLGRVRFTREVRGDVVVSVDPRGASGLRLVNEHRPAAEDRNWVAAGAFSDITGGVEDGSGGSGASAAPGEVPCKGFRVRWSSRRPVVVLSLPSRCLHDGDYGAVRFAVLTERASGDSDYAPGNRRRVTGWIPRG